MNDGVQWGTTNSLLNLIEYRLRENTALLSRVNGGRPKAQKYNPTPWKREGHMGHVNGRSVEEVKAYLDSLMA